MGDVLQARDNAAIFKLEQFEGPLDLLLFLIKKNIWIMPSAPILSA